eukprot:GHVP01057592.1.p1 GENE.GHVP01057592.1~~GHVP01057592.1.p1  ORF type:complete len:133 (-),score=7.12 GHVP01057592.1:299-697(-)
MNKIKKVQLVTLFKTFLVKMKFKIYLPFWRNKLRKSALKKFWCPNEEIGARNTNNATRIVSETLTSPSCNSITPRSGKHCPVRGRTLGLLFLRSGFDAAHLCPTERRIFLRLHFLYKEHDPQPTKPITPIPR